MRPAELFAIAASTARARPVPPPATEDADAFARSLDSQLRRSAADDGRRSATGATTTAVAPTESTAEAAGADATPVRDGSRGGRFGIQAHLAQAEGRAARVEWRTFLQDLREAGILGGPRANAFSALVADAGTSTPKPAPDQAPPFSQALDALGAAIQAAIADPAANPAQSGQLPAAVQSALDAAAVLAPPALQARMQAFAARLAGGLAAAMAEASAETLVETPADAARTGKRMDSPVAQAVLAAVAGAGEGASLSILRALQDKDAAVRGAATGSTSTTADVAAAPVADGKVAGDPGSAAKVADATPAGKMSGAETAAVTAEEIAGRSARAGDFVSGRAELTSQTTPAASAPAAEAHAAALVATRGAPELVAQMAAVISRKLEGRVTRFNMELNPAELGRVDVRLNIDKDGRVAAQMSFDNPAAAADMRGKADELRRQLQESGFNVASEDLTFSDRGAGQGFQGKDQAFVDPEVFRAGAFREADRTARLAEDAGRLSIRATLGLDMRV